MDVDTKHAYLFKDIFKKLVDFTTSSSWKAVDDGLLMKCLDVSHVSLCEVFLAKPIFQRYSCSPGEEMTFHMVETNKMLQSIVTDRQESLSLKKERGGDKVHLTVYNKEGNVTAECKKLSLFTADEEEIPPTLSDYDTLIHMGSDVFKRLIEQLEKLHDELTIQIETTERIAFCIKPQAGDLVKYVYADLTGQEKEKVAQVKNTIEKLKEKTAAGKKRKATAEEETVESMVQRQHKLEAVLENITDQKREARIAFLNQPLSCRFSLKYLKMIADTTVFSSEVEIKLGKGLLMITHTLPQDPTSKSFIRYYLAPKNDEE